MMKKLLVLSLVLGIASLATAGLSMSYDGSAISVSNDEPMLGGINHGLGIIGPAVVTDDLTLRTENAPSAIPQIFLYTGAEAVGFGLPYDGGFNTLVWGDPDPQVASAAGFWFSMPLPGLVEVAQGEHTVQVDLITGDATPLGSMYLAPIPEPATLALLGLGALALRRRK